MDISIKSLLTVDGFVCPTCGKRHRGLLRDCLIGDGVIARLPELLEMYRVQNPFILCDGDTYRAAGERVAQTLADAGISFTLHKIDRTKPAPDEAIVGETVMFCPVECDSVIAVGGGVINDTCKILAAAKRVPDIFVATAPSMDGFASATSSMERAGLKVSLASKCPDAVVGDLSVLAAAPKHMIASGIGDILAKYIGLTDWRIAHLLLDEYYCPTVAGMIDATLTICRETASDAVRGDHDAIAALTEGLVLSGMAMNFAGCSRPASGMEHYASHIVDMRAMAFGTPADLHGIQCGIATLWSVRYLEKLRGVTPDPEKARKAAEQFDLEKWNAFLREKLGKGAEAMIAGELKEKKYDLAKHAARLERIVTHWDDILAILADLPDSGELEAFMKAIGHPTEPEEIGLTADEFRQAFLMGKDIRDKYVFTRLLWDLGILEELVLGE